MKLASTGAQGMFPRLPRGIQATTVFVSLVLSALLTAVAMRLPDLRWVAWISFLPLFVVVRLRRPLPAALAGGTWGACLHLFSTIGPLPAATSLAPGLGSSAWLLVLLIAIPAVYVALAARPARAVTFQLLTLALGWTMVEVVLQLHTPSRPSHTLLIDSQDAALHGHWLTRLLGYVSAAFLVACANASLLGILCAVRLSLPVGRSFTGLPGFVGWHRRHRTVPIHSWNLSQASPRAPPIPVPAVL